MSTDALALAGLMAGEEGAFEAIYTRHYRTVYGILYRLVGDEAEDLAQEVFLKLYLQPPARAGGAGGDSLQAWLCRVALHVGYNALRARRRWKEHRDALVADRSQEAWQGGAEPNPEAYAERNEERSRVRQTLANLGQREVSILVLRHSGWSYGEIAAVVGVAPTSVGALLARAERAFARTYERVAGPAGTAGESNAREGNDAVSG